MEEEVGMVVSRRDLCVSEALTMKLRHLETRREYREKANTEGRSWGASTVGIGRYCENREDTVQQSQSLSSHP